MEGTEYNTIVSAHIKSVDNLIKLLAYTANSGNAHAMGIETILT